MVEYLNLIYMHRYACSNEEITFFQDFLEFWEFLENLEEMVPDHIILLGSGDHTSSAHYSSESWTKSDWYCKNTSNVLLRNWNLWLNDSTEKWYTIQRSINSPARNKTIKRPGEECNYPYSTRLTDNIELSWNFWLAI